MISLLFFTYANQAKGGSSTSKSYFTPFVCIRDHDTNRFHCKEQYSYLIGIYKPNLFLGSHIFNVLSYFCLERFSPLSLLLILRIGLIFTSNGNNNFSLQEYLSYGGQ